MPDESVTFTTRFWIMLGISGFNIVLMIMCIGSIRACMDIATLIKTKQVEFKDDINTIATNLRNDLSKDAERINGVIERAERHLSTMLPPIDGTEPDARWVKIAEHPSYADGLDNYGDIPGAHDDVLDIRYNENSREWEMLLKVEESDDDTAAQQMPIIKRQ